MSTPNPLLAHLLSTPPYIPELHADDCDDVTCARCVKPPTSTSRMDVPLPVVAAEVKALAEKRLSAGCLAEQSHQLDPADTAFARLACEHDDCCSTEADYPGWTPGGQA